MNGSGSNDTDISVSNKPGSRSSGDFFFKLAGNRSTDELMMTHSAEFEKVISERQTKIMDTHQRLSSFD